MKATLVVMALAVISLTVGIWACGGSAPPANTPGSSGSAAAPASPAPPSGGW